MDKNKSILNVTVSLSFKITTMVLAIVVRRFLINICGNEINGLNALYLSIIGFMSVAELGLGTAITFSMYKPIVAGQKDKVSALYHLYQRLYLLIGGIILLVGLLLSPFLHYFAKDYTQLNVNLQFTFILMLISVVLTYLFSAKTALFNAYKNNYVTTAITSGGYLFQYLLQIFVLIFTSSFVAYLICRIVTALVQWLITELLVWRNYREILTNRQKIDNETKKDLLQSMKAMFMHKVGYVLVNSVDSIIISVFVGVIALGSYSNYITILTSLIGVLSLVFTSLTSVIGHLYVSESQETTQKHCEAFHLLNFIMGAVFFLGIYAIIDDVIAILFSSDLVVSRNISFVITLNGFVQFMRQTVLMFRDATGTFYHDRWKPLAEGLFNVVFSILFVKWIGIAGVILATIATNLLICHVIEPYVLYKNAFSQSPARYYCKNYSWILLFAAALVLVNSCMVEISSRWQQLITNGFISVVISIVICTVTIILNKETFSYMIQMMRKK